MKEKVAIVTGAARGLGGACALRTGQTILVDGGSAMS
jgi:NAD(P)-dependent dehydrogenase (short-subunit alcohol dehydrogenase family)